MLEGAKLIGAGAAIIASAGAAIGIGNVFSSSIHSMARNPSLAKQSFGYAILGFALTEDIASRQRYHSAHQVEEQIQPTRASSVGHQDSLGAWGGDV
uniref:ATP synthase subunit 9, mitochondrial n=1 Tax=Tanacetum cinerariifolium TaxID=118510 RepID=A0A699JXZ1_TANCI|nr:ATP synthase F0 subunit 9, mitochondrial [Tanacetum cinerariifolium]